MAAFPATAATLASRKNVLKRAFAWSAAFMLLGIILCGVGASQMTTTCPATCIQRSCTTTYYQKYACDCGGYCSEGTKSPGAVLVIGIVAMVSSFLSFVVAGLRWTLIRRQEQSEAAMKESANKAQVYAQQVPMTNYPMTQIGQPVQQTFAYPPQQTVAYPAQQTVAYPAQQTVAYPAQQTVAYPAQQTVGYPAQQTVAYPAQQTVAYPAQQTVAYPAQQTVGYPAQHAGQMMIVDINGVPTLVSLAAPLAASSIPAAATSPAPVATAIPAEGQTDQM